MNRKIIVGLSVESVSNAKLKLFAYRDEVKNAIKSATTALMQDAADYLERILQIEQVPEDQRITISATIHDNGRGFTLTMIGDGVGFVEFGTGAYADEQHMFREEAPFPVFSGSFSDTVGEGTWDAYIRSGAYADKNGEYLYNRYPVRPLYETSVWIQQNAAQYYTGAFARIKL